MWSYWQLFEADNDQIRVGGLDINTGGQFDGLIGGLSWQIDTNESTEFIHQQHQKISGNKSRRNKQYCKLNYWMYLPK